MLKHAIGGLLYVIKKYWTYFGKNCPWNEFDELIRKYAILLIDIDCKHGNPSEVKAWLN